MIDNALHLLYWFTVVSISIVPIFAAGELVAALFSKRVRRYIAAHPAAHVALFAFAVFLMFLLMPAPSAPPLR